MRNFDNGLAVVRAENGTELDKSQNWLHHVFSLRELTHFSRALRLPGPPASLRRAVRSPHHKANAQVPVMPRLTRLGSCNRAEMEHVCRLNTSKPMRVCLQSA